MADGGATTEAQRLCLDCGFCCDGTLFERLDVASGELVVLRRSKSANAQGSKPSGSAEEDGNRVWELPCEHLDAVGAGGAGSCAVYPERPRTCVQFRCALLSALVSGEKQYEQCRKTVADVRARRAELQRTLDLPGRGALWHEAAHRLVELGALDDAASRRLHAAALMSAAEFRAICMRVFGSLPGSRASR